MAHLLGSVRIRVRIAIIFLIPLFGLAFISALIVYDRTATMSRQSALIGLADLASSMSDLVHELQKERGASGVFVSSKGQRFAQEVEDQRKLTDARRQAFGEALGRTDSRALGTAAASRLQAARDAFDQLDQKRRDISALTIAAPDSFAYFTRTILAALDVVAELGADATEVEIAGAVAAYAALLQGKERAGQERATGAAQFAAGKFTLSSLVRLVQLQAEQETYWRQFAAAAAPAQREFFGRTIAGRIVDDVARMRQAIVADGLNDTNAIATPAEWWAATTGRIDLLKAVEDRLGVDLRTIAARLVAEARRELLVISAGFAAALALSVLFAVVVIRSITRPVAGMTGAMTALAGGDLKVPVPALENRDEIGAMAKAVQVFKDNMIHTAELEAAARQENEQKERRRQSVEKLVQEFGREIDGVVQAVASAATQMRSNSESMSSTAEETSRQSTAVAAASEQASTNVQTVASASEELSSSINEISRQVTQSARIANQAVEEAERTNRSVQGLAEAAQKIGDVVKLINDIAGQTNLLALNATIEAARAGEAGKGFTVVASEVKSLATQTAKATEDIAAQINAIQAATKDSVAAIQGIGKTIGEINEIATTIASAVEEQGAATLEISRNVQEAAKGTGEVSANIAGVTQAAGETGEAAGQVLAASSELSTQAERLRAQVDKFVADIRAA
jgi:methyl-accepting chemotaxis protein